MAEGNRRQEILPRAVSHTSISLFIMSPKRSLGDIFTVVKELPSELICHLPVQVN